MACASTGREERENNVTDAIRGQAVRKLANSDSLDDKEPVALRGIIAQIVGVAVAVLIFKGVIEPDEGAAIGVQSEVIVGAIISLASIVGIVAQRAKAYAPKTAAEIAVENAIAAPGTPPTLVTPP